MIGSSSIILEGDGNFALSGNVLAVYVRPLSVLEKLSAILESKEVYMEKADAIPHGSEREVLQKLLES